MKYVRCKVSAWGQTYGIYQGKTYLVQRETIFGGRPTYVLPTLIAPQEFYQDEFEVVSCPCSVKNCLKHRAKL